jgi:hypothetical protein
MSVPQDVLVWLLSVELGHDKLALLLLCSVSLYALATNLAHRLALDGSRHGRWAIQLARLLYYLGMPCTVLWRGGIVSQMGIPTTYAGQDTSVLAVSLLGLEAQDMLLVGRGLVLGAGAMCLLVIVWVWYARAVPSALEASVQMPWWTALWEAVLMQLHWAFYRGFLIALIPDRTTASFASLALVALCWLSSPQRRHDLFTLRGYLVVQDWMCALLTAFLALTTQALWLLVLMHALWLWVGGRVLAHFLRASANPIDSRSGGFSRPNPPEGSDPQGNCI